MTRVLVTRPEPGAARTLHTLIERGVDAEAIALTQIKALAFDAPNSSFDAVIITSQNAIVHGAALLAPHKLKPVFAVGQRAAFTLQELGHRTVQWAETAHELSPLIIRQSPKNAFYICGQTRKPELETALANAGIRVESLEVYAAIRTVNAPEKLKEFFVSAANRIILFHAPSAADAFVLAMRDQNLPENTQFLCMSAAIAAQLPEHWQTKTILADNPDDAAMMSGVDKLLAQNHLRQA